MLLRFVTKNTNFTNKVNCYKFISFKVPFTISNNPSFAFLYKEEGV